MSTRIGVIIPAAGASARFGEGRDKLDADLGGRPLLHRTVELFANREDVDAVVVAGPADPDRYEKFKVRHGDKLGLLGVRLCQGGPEHRYETVKNALEHIPEDCPHIAVHDAARPCASTELIDRVFAAAEKHDAVIPAIECPDTLKRVSELGKADADVDPLDAILGDAGKANVQVRTVEETVSRDRLVLVQTPQVFKADLLRRAYAQDDLSSTDDAGLVERLGETVVVVEGEPRNIKITRPDDLKMATAILGLRPAKERAPHKRF